MEARVTVTIDEALKLRYPWPEFVLLFEVRNGTGWARQEVRTADAIAIGTWPSRGLELHGFEIKAHRSDWLHEKKTPEKADAIARFVDRWWLVTQDDTVAHADEVPARWGWLSLTAKGLRCHKDAPSLHDETRECPLDRLMLAALMRAAFDQSWRAKDIDKQIAKAVEAEVKSSNELFERTAKRAAERIEQLEQAIAKFEEASHVQIRQPEWSGQTPKRVGEAVRFVLDGGLRPCSQRLAGIENDLEHLLRQLRAVRKVTEAVEPAVKSAQGALFVHVTGTMEGAP